MLIQNFRPGVIERLGLGYEDVRRGVTGAGAFVQTSLLEALIDLQFEVLTTHLNDGMRLPLRR